MHIAALWVLFFVRCSGLDQKLVELCSHHRRKATNIALNKPATASSIFGGTSPSLTVDGDTASQSSLFHTSNDGEQWLQVDLEAPVEIGLVKIHHRTDCCGERIN